MRTGCFLNDIPDNLQPSKLRLGRLMERKWRMLKVTMIITVRICLRSKRRTLTAQIKQLFIRRNIKILLSPVLAGLSWGNAPRERAFDFADDEQSASA